MAAVQEVKGADSKGKTAEDTLRAVVLGPEEVVNDTQAVTEVRRGARARGEPWRI